MAYTIQMNCFILLNIFPPEIVNIIYRFILIDKSENIIYHNCNAYFVKKFALNKSIQFLLETHKTSDSVIKDFNYALNFVLNNYYSKKYYNNYFWNNYLNVLSSKLMHIHNNIILKHCNVSVKYLKYLINTWFKLCKKYNIRLALLYKKNNNVSSTDYISIYEYTRNMKPIRTLNKLLCFPCVVYDDLDGYPEHYEINESIMYIENFLG